LQDDDRFVDVADDDVGSAVVIEVAKSGALTHLFGLEEGAGLFRDVLKADLPRLVSRLAEIVQQDGILKKLRRFDRKANDMAVGDEDILRAVEIAIDEACPETDVIEADGRDSGAATGKHKWHEGNSHGHQEVGEQKLMRQIKGGGKLLSAHDPRVILTVRWPWGRVQTWAGWASTATGAGGKES
jgi:hypothetical protein